MTARLLGTLLLACAGAGLGACGAVRRQAVEKRIRLLSRLWTYLEELLTCRALTGPMLLHAAAENPAFAALALPADSDCTLSALREDQAMMTTLAGLIVVLSMLVRQISDLFVLIKALFEL